MNGQYISCNIKLSNKKNLKSVVIRKKKRKFNIYKKYLDQKQCFFLMKKLPI